MYGGKDERGRQSLLTQLLQGIEDGVEPRLVGLDNTVPPVVRALRDQAPGVGKKEVVVVPQVQPLGVPPGVVRRQPHRDVLMRFLHLASLQHQVEAPARTGFLTPMVPLGARKSSPRYKWSHRSQCGIIPR